jgi:hypothetical protein
MESGEADTGSLCLADNLFGDSLFDASCRLGGKPTGHFL